MNFLPLAVAFVAWGADALPPTPRLSRERDQYQAQVQRNIELGNLNDRFPEGFAAMREHWNAVLSSGEECDDSILEQLTAELWTDHGEPELNEANQFFLVDAIRRAAENCEALSVETRRALAGKLEEFTRLGGGRSTPTTQSDLAVTLSLLAPDDKIQRLAGELLRDAAGWVAAVDADPAIRDAVLRNGAFVLGESFWINARMPDDGTMSEPCRRVAARISALIDSPGDRPDRLLRDIRDATASALEGCADRPASDKLIARLLLVFRVMLERRPPLPDRVAAFLDETLLQLARRESRRLTDLHWSLWRDAVRALGSARISDGMQRYIRATLTEPSLSAAQRAAVESLKRFVPE